VGLTPRRRPDPHALLGWLSAASLAALAATLGRVEWIDAWATAHLAGVRGCTEGASATMLTDAAPYGAALTLALAVAYAWWWNGHRREIVTVLGAFVVALLLVQGLKVTFERDRPGVPPFAQSGSQSFPSGHAANSAVAVAAALAVTRETSKRWARGARVAVAVAGVGSVAAVAFTRLYLNRHWATDVVAGMLIGVAFWGFVTARRGPIARALLTVVIAVVIPGLLLAGAAGGRIHLPAPSTLSDSGTAGARLLRHARLRQVVGGEWVPQRRPRARGFLRLDRPEFALAVGARQPRHAVLKMVAAPLGALARAPRCAWIEVSVNGRPVARRPLKRVWRVYAFALPLAAGRNDVRVAAGAAPPGQPALALAVLSLEGRPEAPAIFAAGAVAPPPARQRRRGPHARRC
jgi:undecaprenyl-diphosphatase